jgi:MFS family permease
MSSLMGLGAVFGGLATAGAKRKPATSLAWTAIVFGVLHLAAALMPTLAAFYVAMVAVGAASIRFLALGNSTLQLAAAPEMRGRVMGLWAVAFLGSTPIGGPIIGWIGEHVNPRVAMAVGASATLTAALCLPRRGSWRSARPEPIPVCRGWRRRSCSHRAASQ